MRRGVYLALTILVLAVCLAQSSALPLKHIARQQMQTLEVESSAARAVAIGARLAVNKQLSNSKLSAADKLAAKNYILTASNAYSYPSLASTCYYCSTCKSGVIWGVKNAQAYLSSFHVTILAACHTYVGVPTGAACFGMFTALGGTGCLALGPAAAACVPALATASAAICPFVGGTAAQNAYNFLSNWVDGMTNHVTGLSLSQTQMVNKYCMQGSAPLCPTTSTFPKIWASYAANKGKPAPNGCDALFPAFIVTPTN